MLDSYLRHYPSRLLKARCPGCGRSKTYLTDDLEKRFGDCQLRGLKTTLADAWQCPRLLVVGWNECQLQISIEEKPRTGSQIITVPAVLRRWRANSADPQIKLGDLREWHCLWGICSCGHAYFISHKDLRMRFGAEARLGELQKRLRCRKGRSHQHVMFALSTEKR